MEKRNNQASKYRQRGETKMRVATHVNAMTASSNPPNEYPVQLGLFPGRACPSEAKPATRRGKTTDTARSRRNGVRGGDTQRWTNAITGETLFTLEGEPSSGTGAYKRKRSRRLDGEQGVGGGHSTEERRENRREGRAATSVMWANQRKTTGLPPRGSASSRSKSVRRRKPPQRMDNVRTRQRTLYRVAKSDPTRQFPRLYDKVCRLDVLQEAWRRVKAHRGAAGVDQVDIETIQADGEDRFLEEIRQALVTQTYRVAPIRRVHIPKPGQPGQTRPLGIPTLTDRVVQMAVKLVIEPLFEPDFLPCSYGFRPQRTPRMALGRIVASVNAGYRQVVDVDIRQYFDTIDQTHLMRLVNRRVADIRVLRLLRAWLKAGVLEDGQVRHPVKGTPQGGVISPLLANIYLHEIDRQWHTPTGERHRGVRLIRYADDMVFLVKSAVQSTAVWQRLHQQLAALGLTVNAAKSRVTSVQEGFRFLGFECRTRQERLYLWPGAKAVRQVGERVRQVIRGHPYSERLPHVIQAVNRVVIGWCTYFRVGHSNRVFHQVDHSIRETVQGWLRHKYQIPWWQAKRRWSYRILHETYRLYRMVGKVSHLAEVGACTW